MSDAYFNHPERTAIITGAASGIGLGIAEHFAREGMAVVCADLNESGAEAVVARLTAAGYRALGLGVDITDEVSVADMTVQAIEWSGRIDTAICNAGVMVEGEILSLSLADWNHAMNINATGAFLTARAVLPHHCARSVAAPDRRRWGNAGFHRFDRGACRNEGRCRVLRSQRRCCGTHAAACRRLRWTGHPGQRRRARGHPNAVVGGAVPIPRFGRRAFPEAFGSGDCALSHLPLGNDGRDRGDRLLPRVRSIFLDYRPDHPGRWRASRTALTGSTHLSRKPERYLREGDKGAEN